MPKRKPKTKAELKAMRERREAVDRRNEAIARAGVRPPDGLTFGKQKPPPRQP